MHGGGRRSTDGVGGYTITLGPPVVGPSPLESPEPEEPVRTRTRLAAFALALGSALGLGYAAGVVVGPIGAPASPGHSAPGDHGGDR